MKTLSNVILAVNLIAAACDADLNHEVRSHVSIQDLLSLHNLYQTEMDCEVRYAN